MRTKRLQVKLIWLHMTRTQNVNSVNIQMLGEKKKQPVFPDTPSELEQTSCEELIPGLQASAVDNAPQESGMSHAPVSCLLLA